MTSHDFCHVLLIRSTCISPTHIQEAQGHKSQKEGSLRAISVAAYHAFIPVADLIFPTWLYQALLEPCAPLQPCHSPTKMWSQCPHSLHLGKILQVSIHVKEQKRCDVTFKTFNLFSGDIHFLNSAALLKGSPRSLWRGAKPSGPNPELIPQLTASTNMPCECALLEGTPWLMP